jgi:hypothetical protein
MQEVIMANSLRRADVPSSVNFREEDSVQQGLDHDQELHQEVVLSELPLSDGPISRATDGSMPLLEERERKGSDRDAVLSLDATGPLQFHHVTQQQLVARKAQILEILQRSSPKGSPSSDQNGERLDGGS